MTAPAGGGAGGVARARRGGEVRREVTIVNQRGLHARAAAQFCKLAGSFKKADIKVVRDGVTVSGCSIMGLMMLAAAPGSAIEIVARGADAEAAVEALAKLVADGFGEED
ncbi:MAG: HPr family phosphocarrier protein [Candidatus Eiseniibacteriota bacterium]